MVVCGYDALHNRRVDGDLFVLLPFIVALVATLLYVLYTQLQLIFCCMFFTTFSYFNISFTRRGREKKRKRRDGVDSYSLFTSISNLNVLCFHRLNIVYKCIKCYRVFLDYFCWPSTTDHGTDSTNGPYSG